MVDIVAFIFLVGLSILFVAIVIPLLKRYTGEDHSILNDYLRLRYFKSLRNLKSLENDINSQINYLDELKAQTFLLKVQKLLSSLSNGFKANFPEILKQLRKIEYILEQKIK